MRYSIIIPTLNEENLIEDLLKQLCPERLKSKYDFEIIVSDGGSSDRTLEIAEKFADKIIRNNSAERQTIAQGRNIGAAGASGEILLFINGDVIISDPEKLFSIIDTKFYNSNFAAATTKVKIFPKDEIFTDKIFLGFYNAYFHFLNFIGLGMGRGECQIIRRSVFNAIGGNEESFAAGEDFDLYIRIRRKGKVLFCKDIVIYESPRRFRKYGHLFILFSWLLNSISIILFNRSFVKDWEEVR